MSTTNVTISATANKLATAIIFHPTAMNCAAWNDFLRLNLFFYRETSKQNIKLTSTDLISNDIRHKAIFCTRNLSTDTCVEAVDFETK